MNPADHAKAMEKLLLRYTKMHQNHDQGLCHKSRILANYTISLAFDGKWEPPATINAG
jgi:hypothetical protein